MREVLPRLRTWQHHLERVTPNETEIVEPPADTWFEVLDAKTVRFRFDPGPNAEAHDVEWSPEPDFTNKSGQRVHSEAHQVVVPVSNAFSCDKKYYFRVRGLRGAVTSRWSPTAVYGHPVPAALLKMEAGHTVDNVEEENPLINVTIVLPRTATLGGRTITDPEAQFTSHVDLEADWSALAAELAAGATSMTVTTGQGNYFKEQGFYKIESEIVKVTSVSGDIVTIERAQLGTTDATHAVSTTIRFYARVLREMFTAGAKQGTFAVVVTISNPEKVRQRDFEAWAVNRCGDRGPKSTATALLNTPDLIADLAAEPFFQKVVLRWSELPWPAYRYEIYHSNDAPIPIADLDPTQTAGVTLKARPLADHLGEATWVHDIAFQTGVVHFYGVRAVDIFGGFRTPGGGDTVGPLQPDQFATQPAPDVTNISATEGPSLDPGSTLPSRSRVRQLARSAVTCGFDPPDAAADPDSLWDACRIFLQPVGVKANLAAAMDATQTTMRVTFADLEKILFWRFFKIDSEVVELTGVDYSKDPAIEDNVTIARAQFGTTAASHLSGAGLQAHINPVQMTEGPEAPLFFTYSPIGDVTLYFVSVSVDGRQNQVLASPNLTVTLDGRTSAPLEVQNLRGIKTATGGKIFWSEGKEPDLDYYEVADLGSRTLQNQVDIADKHITARVDARPNSQVRAQWEWEEIEYEGEISAGASSVVIGSVAAPIARLVENRFDPIGSPAVSETLRFSWVSNIDELTENSYNINSNDEDTINLASSPGEAPATGVAQVRFHIGGRAHKFYVRAVNNAGMASEWRPVEGTFLDLSATAPDGTNDIGVPRIQNVQLGWSPQAFWTVGPVGVKNLIVVMGGPPDSRASGVVAIRAVARSEDEAEAGGLRRNINGIIAWDVEIQHSKDGVNNLGTSKFQFKAGVDDLSFSYQTPPAGTGHFTAQQLLPLIELPNEGIAQVRLRARNWFGWGSWHVIAADFVPPGGVPFFTGDKAQIQEPSTAALAGAGTDELEPNVAQGVVHKLTLTKNITVKPPKYKGANTAHGSGDAPEVGQYVTLILTQDGIGGRAITFDASYKGLDNKPPDLRPNRYAAWTFLAESSTVFRCIAYITGDA